MRQHPLVPKVSLRCRSPRKWCGHRESKRESVHERWFNGVGVSFDLATGGNCVFKSNKNHTMTTNSLVREFRFPINKKNHR